MGSLWSRREQLVALASRYAVPAIYAHQEFAAVLALDHLRAHGVEITFQEDRQGGVLNGPRAYFHDPDGTVLEFIDLTNYAGSPS